MKKTKKNNSIKAKSKKITSKKTKSTKIKTKNGVIFSIANQDSYNYVCIKKDWNSIGRLHKFFTLYFRGSHVSNFNNVYYKNWNECEQENIKLIKNKLSDLVDGRMHFSKKSNCVDIVFGKSKMFVVAKLSKKETNNFRKFIFANFNFCEYSDPAKKKSKSKKNNKSKAKTSKSKSKVKISKSKPKDKSIKIKNKSIKPKQNSIKSKPKLTKSNKKLKRKK